jgi:hypothetical protein
MGVRKSRVPLVVINTQKLIELEFSTLPVKALEFAYSTPNMPMNFHKFSVLEAFVKMLNHLIFNVNMTTIIFSC